MIYTVVYLRSADDDKLRVQFQHEGYSVVSCRGESFTIAERGVQLVSGLVVDEYHFRYLCDKKRGSLMSLRVSDYDVWCWSESKEKTCYAIFRIPNYENYIKLSSKLEHDDFISLLDRFTFSYEG